MFHLLAACLLALLVENPAPKPSLKSTPVPAPTLTGAVADRAGKPVADALVIVRPLQHENEPPQTTHTDAQGAFRITLPSAGLVTVRVEAAGFAPQTLQKQRPAAALRVRLLPGAQISGVVRDAATGRPIDGALVESRSPGSEAAPWEPGAGRVETRSDREGRFRLDGLGPGRQRVRAAARGYGAQLHSAVRPGTSIEFLLPPGAAIVGGVRDAQDRPLSGALVELEEADGALFQPAYRPVATDTRGHFEILGLEPGKFRLVARHRELAPAVSDVFSLVEGGEEQVDLVLRPGVTVAGRLVGPDQGAVRGSVTLAEVDGQPAPETLVATSKAEAGADGHFEPRARPARKPGAGRGRSGIRAATGRGQRRDEGHRPRRRDARDGARDRGTCDRRQPCPGSRRGARGLAVGDRSQARRGGSGAEQPFRRGGALRDRGTRRRHLRGRGPGLRLRPCAAAGRGRGEGCHPRAGGGGQPDRSGGGRGPEPVADFRVVAQVRRAEDDLRAWQRPYIKPFSAADGRFVLDGVGAGTYVVDVSAPEHVTSDRQGRPGAERLGERPRPAGAARGRHRARDRGGHRGRRRRGGRGDGVWPIRQRASASLLRRRRAATAPSRWEASRRGRSRSSRVIRPTRTAGARSRSIRPAVPPK